MSTLHEINDFYENFLIKYIDNYSINSVNNLFYLYESRGINRSFEDTVSYVWSFISSDDNNNNWYYKENGDYVTITPILPLNDDCFIDDIRVALFLTKDKSNIEGVFNKQSCSYSEEKDKLTNVYITIYQQMSNGKEIDKLKFYTSMFHELQHAYAEYNALKVIAKAKKNDMSKYSEKQDIKIRAEQTYSNILNFQSDKMKQYFVDRFADMLYYMDVNEINSHMSEMIPYIKEHEEIDFKTYNKYLQEIPGYNVINILKANQELFEKFTDINIRKQIGDVIGQEIYNGRYKGLTCYYELIKKLNKSLLYAQKQFYKILAYTLEINKRRGSSSFIKENNDRKKRPFGKDDNLREMFNKN